MKPLVDISVLFPAMWQAHVEHRRCRVWLDDAMDFYQVQLAAAHGVKFATRDRGVAAE